VKIDGGILVQDVDDQFSTDFKVVTETQPTEQQEKALLFCSKSGKICKIKRYRSFKRNSSFRNWRRSSE
jgi:AICAR transformylase/IMP cyclohydrolase PurH